MSERNYIRTEQELDNQLSGLIEVRDLIQALGGTSWLSAGTCLGAVRSNDFIPWDWNCSVGYKNCGHEEIISGLQSLGFKTGVALKGENNKFVCIKAKKNGVKYIIENRVISECGKWELRPNHKGPAHFGESFRPQLLRGEYFLVPFDAEEALAWHYGADWRTPKRVEHRNEVINPEHHIRKRDNLK
jgi:hypothetical protein